MTPKVCITSIDYNAKLNNSKSFNRYQMPSYFLDRVSRTASMSGKNKKIGVFSRHASGVSNIMNIIEH